MLRGCRDQVTEVTERAEVGVHRFVSAFLRADAPGATRLTGRGRLVVGSLAVTRADGVDRREVEHVEPHSRDVGQQPFHVRKLPDRPREQLVPGAEPGLHRLDDHLHLTRVDGGQAPVGVTAHQRARLAVEGRSWAAAERFRQRQQPS